MEKPDDIPPKPDLPAVDAAELERNARRMMNLSRPPEGWPKPGRRGKTKEG